MLNKFRKKFHHLNKILVSRAALVHNHTILQALQPEAEICHVLKSNAYGHGLTTVAPVFDSLNSPYLIVDSLHEAYELQKIKVSTPILILGYTDPENFKVKQLPFHFTVFDVETARVLNKFQPGCSIHLFVDTGMNREGIALSELEKFVLELKKLKNLKILGLASHFADADNPDSLNFTKKQLANYHRALDILEKHQIHPKWKHISASAGTVKIKDSVFNMFRVGLAGYGITPLESNDDFYSKVTLKPALRFVSTLAQIKEIKKGDRVGYNGTFIAPRKMTIGLVPAGYYDGVDRRLSNKGVMKIRGVECPIIGRVSMNMTVIDISKVKSPLIGDEVVIYSDDVFDKNTVYSAGEVQTIPYEFLVHLAESIRREII